jgi:hypothetical protein
MHNQKDCSQPLSIGGHPTALWIAPTFSCRMRQANKPQKDRERQRIRILKPPLNVSSTHENCWRMHACLHVPGQWLCWVCFYAFYLYTFTHFYGEGRGCLWMPWRLSLTERDSRVEGRGNTEIIYIYCPIMFVFSSSKGSSNRHGDKYLRLKWNFHRSLLASCP